ncbi:UDP-N-acetylglucosamine 2-epimerase [Sulfurimonas microaerophilic]|uniref:UDP-N-acetylglucosamine 2-epimerase n=1 Tax=Sulfurimonas microaerophilic TaxID=3058392 RepID=UPI0027149B22|nr:UDP-N-acetylglucosamine 2-epimerase [Sulfurimonas sp. hsl 1-7]
MRKICVVTTTRAEYGLLKPLMEEIKSDSLLELQTLITGTHLEAEFGETYKEIEKDFDITAKVPMELSSDTAKDLSCSMAKLQCDITKTLQQLKPDIVVILGDRYEILSVATAAFMLHIPITHIHGGEVTEGAIDDSIRHAVTKLSHLHFTSTEIYKQRVIQLGEDPKRVFNVGALGVENSKKVQRLSKKDFEDSIGCELGEKNLLLTYHPQTISELTPKEQFQALLDALDQFEDIKIIFTKANADEGGKIINTMIDEYVSNNLHRAVSFTSLGQLRYFNAIRYVDAVIGNSSSGILEVPSFNKPTINIGDRQKGRVMAKSVINCSVNKNEIVKAIENVYKSKEKTFTTTKNPYEGIKTAHTIKEELKNVSLQTIFQKSFYDLGGDDAKI